LYFRQGAVIQFRIGRSDLPLLENSQAIPRMIDYADTPQRAAERSSAVLDLLKRQNARRNPRNYAIWYAYVSGAVPDLTRALDILQSNRTEYTEELGRDLWERFFDSQLPERSIGEIGSRLRGQVDEVFRILEAAAAGSEAYGTALRSAAGQLAEVKALDAVKGVIASLAVETQAMAERTRALETRLESSGKEVDDLRKALEASRRETMVDGLTEIANRKAFDVRLRESAAQAMEAGEPLSLLMADIDFFKKFNDAHGHQMGDQVLRLVARVLSESLTGRDLPARYGGEEFAIVLPGTAIAAAVAVGDKIRERVSTRQLVRRSTQERLGGITLSIGAAQFRLGEPLCDLVERADAALYRAKSAGRNRVAVEDVPAPLAAAGDD
jgi:diguanylate cyclase